MSVAVYLIHGVVDHWSPGKSALRNYVPRAAFESYLAARESPFVGWSERKQTDDVLTVDDSTRAAAEACHLARKLGHQVIFFVNPLQIATGLPYFFSLFDSIVDNRTKSVASYL